MLDRRPRFPLLSALAVGVCVLIFLGINTQGAHTEAALRRWGLFSGEDLYNGGYWALITSAFVHVEPIHLLFNMLWLWSLGGAFEHRFGPLVWIAFVLVSAFVSSGIQLLSGDLGIGMSGVVYALFGFGWLSRGRVPEFARTVTDQTVLMFVGWGILSIILTEMGVMRIANLAHGAGFVFGAGLGMAYTSEEGRALPVGALLALAAASIAPLFYNPRSIDWTAKKATEARRAKRYDEAIEHYKRGLDLGANPEWGWYNLAILYAEQNRGDEARRAIAELAKSDPEGAKMLTRLLFESAAHPEAGAAPGPSN